MSGFEAYIQILKAEFQKAANPKISKEMAAYMRNQFAFLGIKTPERRNIQKPFLHKDALPDKSQLHKTVRHFWNKAEREYQYFAQELAMKYSKNIEPDDIELYEYMITNKSWWDTVDMIATKLVGAYLKKYPNRINEYVNKWIASGNIWLQRTAILFQLKYKNDLDTELLQEIILQLKDTDEFFINKAIGWILREYAKINPQWVIDFTNKTKLNNLSMREALKNIKH